MKIFFSDLHARLQNFFQKRRESRRMILCLDLVSYALIGYGWLSREGAPGKYLCVWLAWIFLSFPLLGKDLRKKAYDKNYDWGTGNPDEIKALRSPYRADADWRILILLAVPIVLLLMGRK